MDRTAGLETEYAIRFQPKLSPQFGRPSNYEIYHALIQAIQRRLPTAKARSIKLGVFTANGGAFWLERIRHSVNCGLVEGSTPECRGPRQLLVYQRAQDRLLAEAACDLAHLGDVSLLKNDCDGFGNFYGTQENYEYTCNSPRDLFVWRLGLCLLIPLMLPVWLLLIAVIGLLLVFLILAGLLSLFLVPLTTSEAHRAIRIKLFGESLATGVDNGLDLPDWIEPGILFATAVAAIPLVAGGWLLARFSLLRNLGPQMLPFLISRSIIGGSGFLDSRGRFHMGTKLQGVGVLYGLGAYRFDRPVFNLAHYFKPFLFSAPLLDVANLFSARQRLQLNLGDSNMADEAEYLRIGTTMLVLDVIEAGELPAAPKINHPVRAMKRLSADAALKANVEASDGRRWSALQLQRFYLEACKAFVERRSAVDVSEDAREIVRRWEDVLDALERNPDELVGRLDWVTKRFLIQRAGHNASHSARKKIDLRYHELSNAGYFMRLGRTEFKVSLLDDTDVDKAVRTPPSNTRAATRGRLIREFASGEESMSVSWSTVVLHKGWKAKKVRLGNGAIGRDLQQRHDSADLQPPVA